MPVRTAEAGRTRIARELTWGGLTVAFSFFVATGRLRTYLGREGRGRSEVWDIWQRLASELPGGGSLAIRAGYVVLLMAFVGATLTALWLSLAADGTDELGGSAIAERP